MLILNTIKQHNTSVKKLFVTISLLTFALFELNAQQFRLFYLNELVPQEIETDSVLLFLEKEIVASTLQQDSIKEIKQFLAISSFTRFQLNYNAAFDYAGKALLLAEEKGLPELLAKSHENFGILNLLYQKYETASEHFTLSLEYNQQAVNKGVISKSELFFPNYYNLLSNRDEQNKPAYEAYFKTCSEIVNMTDIEPIYRLYYQMEQARIYQISNAFAKGEKLFLTLIDKAEKLKSSSAEPVHYQSLLMQLYARLARLYEKTGDVEKVGRYFKKSVDVAELNGNQAFYIAHVHGGYAAWLFSQGDYYNAYLENNQARLINDRYQGARRMANKGFLSVRDHYSEELQKKNTEISRQNLELAEKKQEILRSRIILVIILLVVAIAAFIVRSRMAKLKHKKETEDNKRREKEAQKLLEHSNRELTATMLQLIEKEEILNSVRVHLKSSNDNNKTIKHLDTLKKQSVSLWDAFNMRFIEQNQDFYDHLQQQFPKLSSNDLKLCALIKLNFTGQEMATLLGISVASLHVARHRLRKKMNIERGVDLFEFINSI